ncbi:YjeF [Colletotrichum lupini]|uniref:NAD(P)H-hydrate epimerase n=1 Tax=Colletotrichum lupini TaxID=145971 RepID=A0A9Q8SW34_9PEZI|nr:YjeF [Colletotrichum lupini]UQC83846.1 YjeF [Colletotrichum lupini]
MLDVAPFEFFAWTDKISRQMLNLPQEMWEDDIEFDLHWITEDGKPAQMKSRAQIQPTDSFESCPPLDIALMGAHDLKYKTSEAELAFIRKVYEQCSAFLTICGGMFPLLEAGLLAGKTATCPRMIVSAMKKSIPVVDWVETRWAHDGKLWTSSSLLNGTDMMRAFAEATWGGKTNNGTSRTVTPTSRQLSGVVRNYPEASNVNITNFKQKYLGNANNMSLRTIGAKAAAALDKDLMSTGAFSIDQLMELAGLSVSQAIYRVHPPSRGLNILVACGPGNNGGDGLVAARHLCHYGYKPTIYYPKRSKNDLYQRLAQQLVDLDVAFVDDFLTAAKTTDHIVDAIFGFSFSGEVREPFPAVIKALEETKLPVTSVDAPSSWDIENGPPESGPGSSFQPEVLVSLTAPKPLVKHFKGRHFIGGRFVSPGIAEKFNLEIPQYEGIDQVVEVDNNGQKL